MTSNISYEEIISVIDSIDNGSIPRGNRPILASNVRKLTDICQKKRSLSLDIQERILMSFISISSDTSLTIRESVFKGIWNLIEQKNLPIKSIPLVIDVIFEHLNDESDDVRAHAIGILGQIAKLNLTPKIRVSDITECLVRKCNDPARFVGEIALMSIGVMIRNNIISKSDESEASRLFILTTIIAKCHHETTSFQDVAISSLSDYCDKFILPDNFLGEVVSLVIKTCIESTSTIEMKSNAFNILSNLISKNTIPQEYVDRVIEVIISHIDDDNDEVRSHAVWALADVVEKKMLSTELQEKVLDVTLINCDHNHFRVRSTSIWIVSVLIEGGNVSTDKIDDILTLMIKKSYQRQNHLVDGYIWSIRNICYQQKFPLDIEKSVMEFVGISDKYDGAVWNAVSCIRKIIEKNILPSQRLAEVMSLLLRRSYDGHDDVRSSAIWCIGSAIKQSLLNSNYIKLTLNLLIRFSTDYCNRVRCSAVWGLGNMAENKYITSESDVRQLLQLAVFLSDDNYNKVRDNSLMCIESLAKYSLIPLDWIDNAIDIFLTKINDTYDEASTSSLMGLAALIKTKQISTHRLYEVFNGILPLIDRVGVKNGVRIWSSICLCYLYRLHNEDFGTQELTDLIYNPDMVLRCMNILLTCFEQRNEWKYRAIEGVCWYYENAIEDPRAVSYQWTCHCSDVTIKDRMINAINEACVSGEEFYDKIPTPIRKGEVMSTLHKMSSIMELR